MGDSNPKLQAKDRRKSGLFPSELGLSNTRLVPFFDKDFIIRVRATGLPLALWRLDLGVGLEGLRLTAGGRGDDDVEHGGGLARRVRRLDDDAVFPAFGDGLDLHAQV